MFIKHREDEDKDFKTMC